ncbi:MAG: glycosyltransferase family 4 protein [Terrimicrobiaceae bacterium]
MKILVLCYEYPPIGGGGGRVAARVAEGLAKRGHALRVVTSGMDHLPRASVINKVDVHRPGSFRRREDTCSVPEMALHLATAFRPSLRICRDWKPDIIHAHFVVPTGALAFALNRLTGIPYVLTAHLGDVPGGVPEQTDALFKFLNPVIRPIWRKAAAATAVSTFVADLAKKASGVAPRVILNGTDPVSDEPRTAPNTPPHILMLGRLSVQKDPLLAIRALALIRDLDWTFEVIGEGPLGNAMRDLARAENIADRITFSGWLGAEDVDRRLAASDILLMTSLHEGLPVAGIEALHHGLAIVGSRIGGLADIIDAGTNGFLVERTPEAFQETLRKIVGNPQLLQSLRSASREKSRNFRMEDRIADYEDVLAAAALHRGIHLTV